MGRAFAEPLDVAALAKVASVSEAHFIRSFRATFGETPHRYLQRRRVERSMFLLRETDSSVTEICFSVGFSSLGTFSRTFREIVGETPSEYREGHGPMVAPNCFQMANTRPLVAVSRTESPPRTGAGGWIQQCWRSGRHAPFLASGSSHQARRKPQRRGKP